MSRPDGPAVRGQLHPGLRRGALEVTRMRWGGSLLEEARLHGDPALLSVAPHAVAALAADGAAAPAIEAFTPTLDDADLLVQVAEHVSTETSGVSLAEAKVVVSGGRASARPTASDPRGAGGAPRRRGRLLEGRHQLRLAPAHRPGRPDWYQGLARPLHRLRHQRRHPAHRGLQGSKEDPRHQLRRRGADHGQRRLRGDRRPDRDRARGDRRAQEGRRPIDEVIERSPSPRLSR